MAAVDCMDAMSCSRVRAQRRPLVVELIGPAGSGKTTLARALAQRDDFGLGIDLPRIGHVPHLIHHSLILLPVYMRVAGEGGWLTRKEMRSMTYVRAWPRRLARLRRERAVTVLDHGPLFRLARLRATGPRITKSAAFERWWKRSIGLWSGLLDAIVALDAPDEVLIARIRSRDDSHRIKAGSRQEVAAFLERYRSSYREILDAREGGPPLLRIDTSENSPAQVVAATSEELARLAEAASA